MGDFSRGGLGGGGGGGGGGVDHESLGMKLCKEFLVLNTE